MENKPTSVEELFLKLKEYGDTRLDLFRLKAINKVSAFFSSLVTSILLLVIFFLVLICLTIGVALYIGTFLGAPYYGFFIMGGIYLIIGLVFFYSKAKLLKTPISNKLIKELMD
ncbi:MAG: phage holin family protein [Ginsengibacter sp.]